MGTPSDLIEGVAAGIDMFDCIVPMKMAQQGYAYTFQGQKRVSRTDIQANSACLRSRGLGRACIWDGCARPSDGAAAGNWTAGRRGTLAALIWGDRAGGRALSRQGKRNNGCVLKRWNPN